MTKKNNLNSNVQDHNGIRISYHEKVCAERMKTLFKAIDEMGKDIKSLNSNMTRSVDIIAMVMLTVGFLLASVMMINFGEPFMYGIPIIPFFGFISSGIFLLILLFAMFNQMRK
jgi:hypothetical protein